MDELKRAIEAAGRELEKKGWEMGGDTEPCQDVLATEFGEVLMKHLAPVFEQVSDPDHARAMRRARIAALYAELHALEEGDA